jgi:hypothetical protein
MQVTAVGNVIADTTESLIDNGSNVTAAGAIDVWAKDGTPSAIGALETTAGQNTQLTSETSSAPTSLSSLLNDTNILSVVIGVAGAGSQAFNVVMVGNVIADPVKADIVGSTVKSTAGEIDLEALSSSAIAAITAGVAGSGGVSIDAVGLGNDIARG